MYTLFIVVIIIVAVLLGLVVLVQNSKGGGLVSNFSSSNQIMGVRKTTDFLEKATWTLAVILVALSIGTTFIIPPSAGNIDPVNTSLQKQVDKAMQNAVPAIGNEAAGEIPAEQNPTDSIK